MAFAPPTVPWQVTGNHWIALPCVHPADGSIAAIGVISQVMRGAVEFAGAADFLGGGAPPLLRFALEAGGTPIELSGTRMAWQRVFEWLPTFNATAGDLIVRGTVFAPHGRGADFPGFVYALSLENRGTESVTVTCRAHGTLGHRQHRVRTTQPFADANVAITMGDTVALSGAARGPVALAITGDEMVAASSSHEDGSVRWSLTRDVTIPAGERAELALYAAAAIEHDGARAMVARMRTLGWRTLTERTREAISALQQSTGIPTADRLINRHLLFAYFYGAARAIDDARWYLMRTRVPWNERGITARDYDALMWLSPAVQLADAALARELLVRTCELHGYAPGRGVNYIDGTPFDLTFCSDAVAAYPFAVDRYIAQTGDDRIVEDAPIAEALYAANDDLIACRHAALPLYRTDYTASGVPEPLGYTLHGNALIADALEILRQTLDEKTAETVEMPEVVRAAVLRHFATDKEGSRALLAAATDLAGTLSLRDDPVGSAFWIPLYNLVGRDDSLYRRTIRRLEPTDPTDLASYCAQLIGPDAAKTLDWLRRASLDGGFAAEHVDAEGRAVDNGGDASLSALVAYSVWYAVSALGVPAG